MIVDLHNPLAISGGSLRLDREIQIQELEDGLSVDVGLGQHSDCGLLLSLEYLIFAIQSIHEKLMLL